MRHTTRFLISAAIAAVAAMCFLVVDAFYIESVLRLVDVGAIVVLLIVTVLLIYTIAADAKRIGNAEENLRLAKKQVESYSTLTREILTNISSGIRTPLQTIMGFGEILKASIHDEESRTYLDSMVSSGEQLIALLDGILDLSQIEEGYGYFESIDFDLEYLIESVLISQRLQINAKEPTLEMRYAEETPRHFKGFPTSVRKIFINIIGNAIEFTDKGTITITISNGHTPISDTGYARIDVSIKDTGIGIPAWKHEDIFNAFAQAPPGTFAKNKRRCLGLTVAKTLVEMMGGAIAVESEPGKGSNFLFSLELKTVKPLIEKDITLISREALKGKKALIVDENCHSQFILQNFCKSIDIIPTYTTSSSSDAVQWLETASEPIDVIFCDISLPETGVLAFPRAVKKINRPDTMKLIALSANAVPGISARCRNAGFDAYISKPLTNKELRWLLQTVFGDSRDNKDQIITCHLAREILTKGLSVLVVDDDSINQIVVRMTLQRMGCTTVIACNGKEAVEKLQSGCFDVVLMDLQMPVIDGFEAARIIRQDYKSDIPIIAISGHSKEKNFDKCLAAGMNDFLGKPFEIKTLRDKILALAR